MRRANLVALALLLILIAALWMLVLMRETTEAARAPLENAIHSPIVETPRPWASPKVDAASKYVGPLPYVPVTIPEPTRTAEEMSFTVSQDDERPGEALTFLGRYDVVGYDLCADCCGKTDGITKSGTVATVGRTVAVNGLPFGTRLYIDGIGERVVEDRGYLADGVIDVLCNDHVECYAITGVYDVYVLEEME